MNNFEAYKMDGLGNDFIIFDKREKSISLSKDEIIKISDRKNIGSDQVNFIEKDRGVKVGIHFEDDPIQIREISKRCPEVKIVHLVHTLVEKENKRRPFK